MVDGTDNVVPFPAPAPSDLREPSTSERRLGRLVAMHVEPAPAPRARMYGKLPLLLIGVGLACAASVVYFIS